MIGMLFVVTRLRNSAWGVVALFGFTFVAGLMLTPILTVAGGFRNGWQLVGLAGVDDGGDLLHDGGGRDGEQARLLVMGKFLMVGTVVLIVASLANLFFQIPALAVTLSAITVLIFSAWLLHDLSNLIRGGETNYIMATMNLFLNLFNIFISLLNLLLAFTGQRD